MWGRGRGKGKGLTISFTKPRSIKQLQWTSEAKVDFRIPNHVGERKLIRKVKGCNDFTVSSSLVRGTATETCPVKEPMPARDRAWISTRRSEIPCANH